MCVHAVWLRLLARRQRPLQASDHTAAVAATDKHNKHNEQNEHCRDNHTARNHTRTPSPHHATVHLGPMLWYGGATKWRNRSMLEKWWNLQNTKPWFR